MSIYLKLPVRGGGIVSKADDRKLNMETEKVCDEEILKLIRASAIRGIWAYLLGHTCKISEINGDNELEWLCSNSIKLVVGNTFSSTFFSRKDLFYKKASYPINPSVNLKGLGFSSADKSIQLLWPVIQKMVKSSDLGDIHAYFKDASRQQTDQVKNVSDVESLGNSRMGLAMREYIREITVDKKGSIGIGAVDLIKNTINELTINSSFASNFHNSTVHKFSCFTSSLNKTRHWVEKSAQSLVRGEPLVMMCVDFDLVLERRPSAVLVRRLLNGPMVAKWGECGFAVLEYDFDGRIVSPGGFDEPNLSYKELRKLGIKLKKQEWEVG